MKRWIPHFLLVLLAGGLVFGRPTIVPGGRVLRSGDTMTGNLTMSGADISIGGNDLTGSGTGQSFNIASDTNDATTTGLVAAITLSASVNIADTDLIFEVNDSAGASVLSLTEARTLTTGAVTASGALTSDSAAVTNAITGGSATISGALNYGADFTSTRTGASATFISNTNDATTTGLVAAITLSASVNIADTDLIFEVNDSAGASVLSLTEAADLTISGNDFTGSGTGATFNIVSATADATTSGTVAAITLSASADLTDADLIFEINNSAAGSVLALTEAGALTATTTINATTDITLGGNDLTASGTGQTFNVVSDTSAVTTTTAIAAVTLRSSTNNANADLVLNVEDSNLTNLFTVAGSGAVVVSGALSFAGGQIESTNTGQADIIGDITAANASSTTGMYRMYPANVLDANDLVFRVMTASAAATLFSVDYEGDARLNNLSLGGITGTAPSGTGITVTNLDDSRVRAFSSVATFAETALTGAATTEDETIWTVPARTKIQRIVADVTAGFDDGVGPITAVTITCGSTAGGNQYLVSNSVFTVVTLGDAEAELGTAVAGGIGDFPTWGGTTALTCRFTSTGGNVVDLTTGSVTFYIEGTVY